MTSWKRLALAALVCLGPTGPALAHTAGRPEEPGIDFAAAIATALVAALYAVGALRLDRAARFGRVMHRARAASTVTAFALLAVLLADPFDGIARGLFAAHMVEHAVLILVVAPLFILGRPGAALLWGLPRGTRAAVAGFLRAGPTRATVLTLSAPAIATALHGAALWIWHVPTAFEAALASESVHMLQHASFLATALLFWRAVLDGPLGARGHGAGVLYLLVTALHSGFLGVLLTFAPRPLYAAGSPAAAAWGLTPLQDQQLAGLVMWVPCGLLYAAAALWLAGSWISRSGSGRPAAASGGFRDALRP